MQLLMRTYPYGIKDSSPGEQFCEAAARGDVEAVEQLLRSSTDRLFVLDHAYSVRGWSYTALGHAANCTLCTPSASVEGKLSDEAEQKQIRIIRLLVDAKADANAPGEYGLRPLALARTANIATELIRARADVNALDLRGYTVLMFVCTRSLADVVRVLLQHGCDENMENKLGAVAANFGSADVRQLVCASLFPKLYKALDAYMAKDMAWLVATYLVGNPMEPFTKRSAFTKKTNLKATLAVAAGSSAGSGAKDKDKDKDADSDSDDENEQPKTDGKGAVTVSKAVQTA